MVNVDKDFKLFARDNNISSSKIDSFKKMYFPTASYVNPTIIEERQLNVAQMDVFSRLMMDRIIFFGTPVESDVCNIINSQLMYLDNVGDQPIKLHINSPGGSVYDGLSVIDVMNFVNSRVETFCMGLCASMGAVLLANGEKGYRYGLEHGRIMIHQPSGGAKGQSSDINIAAKEIKLLQSQLYNILARTTGKTYEEIEKDCDRDYFMSTDEAAEYGIIDKVIKK